MTEFFAYDQLTWPEVAALPRDVPLVLPFGGGWDLQVLAEQLESPIRIGLLPTIPFGWCSSGLAVSEEILGRYVGNLIHSLNEDGFTRVVALVPQGFNPQWKSRAEFPVIFQPHTSPSTNPMFLPPDSDRGKVILIPIGHTEQHALHLPLSVDTLIIEAIADEATRQLATRTATLPVMPYGVSTHRASFAGTLNAGGRAFEDFWLAVVDNLAARGFDRFYFMSGHGGNMSFLVNIVKYAGERHRRIFCATSFLHTAGQIGAPAIEKHRTSPIGGMGHACELETSFMLCLRPELCHMERVVDEIDFVSTPSYFMDWIEGGALIANPPWDDDTKTGAYGAGSHASAEKGRIWLEAAVAEKIAHIEEIHEQHERREERRRQGYGLWGKSGAAVQK
jgi:creatinine amidohydrolase